MKNERYFWLGAIAVLIVIIFIQRCSKKPCPDVVGVKTDTTRLMIKDTTAWHKPVPINKISSKVQPVQRSSSNGTKEDYTIIAETDTAAILNDYNAIYVYSDTNAVRYGDIIINDTISQNKIKNRQVITNLFIPEVTKTVTLSQPKKAQLYAGINFGATMKDPFGIAGAGLLFKTKNDQLYGASASYTFNGQVYYQVHRYWLIKFHK